MGDYPEALRKVLDHAGYRALRAEQTRRRQAGDRRALGIGVVSYVEITAGGPSTEHGSVEVLDGGRIQVTSGSTIMGQGHETAWSMIIADRLGVPLTSWRSSPATPIWSRRAG